MVTYFTVIIDYRIIHARGACRLAYSVDYVAIHMTRKVSKGTKRKAPMAACNLDSPHSTATQEIANRIVTTCNRCCFPCSVQFSRIGRLSHVLRGTITHVTWLNIRKKGGSFIFWISYNGLPSRPHTTVLECMLDDFTASVHKEISQGSNMKPVKNRVLNASKDLELILHGNIRQLMVVFPLRIRQLTDIAECEQWIEWMTDECNRHMLDTLLVTELENTTAATILTLSQLKQSEPNPAVV